MGIEECVGGGARVEVPGARLGTGRERFGEGADEGRREELFLAAGARVGIRRACVAGTGGGAMEAGEGPTVDEDTGARGGGRGGGMRSDAVGGLIAGGGGGEGPVPVPVVEEVVEEVVAGCEAEADGRGSDSEKLGTDWAGSVVLALALGVTRPSSRTSPSESASASASAASRRGVSRVGGLLTLAL